MGTKFRTINIELSSICNFDCVYCPEFKMTRKKQLIDYDMVIRLIDEISSSGLTENINFYHMGESLLHKRAIEIFQHAKEKNIKIKLNTNGSLLNQQIREQILKMNLDTLFISYHESYVRYNNFNSKKAPITPEKWDELIISTIKDKYRLNSKTNITISLHRTVGTNRKYQVDNVAGLSSKAEYEKTIEKWCDVGRNLSKEYNIPFLYDDLKKGFLKRILSNFDRLTSNFEIIPGLFIQFNKIHTWNNIMVSENVKNRKFKKAVFGSCDALRETMAVFADGSYSLCCADWDGNVVVGNANNETLQEFLSSEKVQNIQKSFSNGKLPFDYCKNCRGGYTYSKWFYNQFHSYIYHNSRFYRKFRSIFKI